MQKQYPLSLFINEVRKDIAFHQTNRRKIDITVFLSTGFRLIFAYRVCRLCYYNRFPFSSLLYFIFSGWMHTRPSCYISPGAIIGSRVRFPHPVGIVIGDKVIIEDDAIIFQHVTIGSHGRGTDNSFKGYPTIGRGAVIYAGAVVIGGISIGEQSVIGANAVVNRDIPANVIAAGVPAKVIKALKE